MAQKQSFNQCQPLPNGGSDLSVPSADRVSEAQTLPTNAANSIRNIYWSIVALVAAIILRSR